MGSTSHKITDSKWYVVVLSSLLGLGAAGALTSMPALFGEIAGDLDLNLTQLGSIWGIGSLAGVFFAIPSGLLGDRFGVRRVIGIGSIAAAVGGFLRGLSGSLAMLIAFMFLFGASQRLAESNQAKVIRIWFEPRQLGLGNGILAAARHTGNALAMMFSASLLSPFLGGWRNVLFFYAGISLIFGTIWLTTIRERKMAVVPGHGSSHTGPSGVPFREALSKVVRVRDIWLVAIALFGIVGCNFSLVGYMPVYFERIGMSSTEAHSLASLGIWGFMAGQFLVPVISDRIGLRKLTYFPAVLLTMAAVFSIPLLTGIPLLVSVFSFGFFGGGAFIHHPVVTTEMKSIGPVYAGTAVGLLFTVSGISSFTFPIVGGMLGDIDPARPFLLWSALPIMSLISFFFVKETGYKARKGVQS